MKRSNLPENKKEEIDALHKNIHRSLQHETKLVGLFQKLPLLDGISIVILNGLCKCTRRCNQLRIRGGAWLFHDIDQMKKLAGKVSAAENI